MPSATASCPCGSQHPAGFICGKAASLLQQHGHEEPCACSHGHEISENHDHAHDPAHDHKHEHGGCCGHDHSAALLVDFSAVGEATDNRAIYRIVNMDYPTEEALIRKKLGTIPGITGLEFNLMQRVLTVNHELPTTDPIVAALKSIDMTPEPLGNNSALEGSIPETRIPWGKLAFAGPFAAFSEAFE